MAVKIHVLHFFFLFSTVNILISMILKLRFQDYANEKDNATTAHCHAILPLSFCWFFELDFHHIGTNYWFEGPISYAVLFVISIVLKNSIFLKINSLENTEVSVSLFSTMHFTRGASPYTSVHPPPPPLAKNIIGKNGNAADSTSAKVFPGKVHDGNRGSSAC